MNRFVRQYLAATFLSAALLLGGASAAGIVANAILQLFALAVVVIVLVGDTLPRRVGAARMLAWLLALAAVVMLAQLIPLPPRLWQALPGRAGIHAGFVLAGMPMPWLSVSLSPDASVAALLSMLPPVGMLLAILASSAIGRRHAILALLGIAMLSLALGAAQIAGGEARGAYLYAQTNLGSAVGLFANRNHFATLLLIAMPFAVALGRSPGPAWRAPARIAWQVVACAIFAALLIGIVAVGSTAGWCLSVPVSGACALLAVKGRWPASIVKHGRAGLLGAAVVVSIALAVAIAWGGIALPAADGDPQHRAVLTATTLDAARDYAPLGSGGGSFGDIYPAYEDPAAASPEYVNHAHDDYAEVLLDYGVPGVLLIVGGIGIWIACAGRVWRSAADAAGHYARAGWVASGVVLAHSAVDYPLRTAAIAVAVTMAAALAVSFDPATEARVAVRRAQQIDRHRLSMTTEEF